MLNEVGFVDVSVTTLKQPWGPWPKDKAKKEIGKILTHITETSFDAHGLALFTQYGGWSTEDAKKIARDCWDEVRGKKCHPYNRVFQVIGRKPE